MDAEELLEKIYEKAKEYIERADCTCDADEPGGECWYRLTEKEKVQRAISEVM